MAHNKKSRRVEDCDLEFSNIALRTRYHPKKKPVGVSQALVAKIVPARKVAPKKVFDTLNLAAQYLSNVESIEDVELWLWEHDFHETDCLEKLRRKCGLIADLLKTRSTSQTESRTEIRGTLGQFYIYRNDSKSVELLAPVDAFVSATGYHLGKAFGFIRPAGSYFPVLYAISGWSQTLQKGEKLLDSKFWTEEVMNFANHYMFKLRSDGWDSANKQPMGKGDASHVEKKLMLAWAYRVLGKATGSKPSFHQLYLIRGVANKDKDAEIRQNDKMCSGCRSFRKTLEMLTGIKFEIDKLPSLGDRVLSKNDRGQKSWPVLEEREKKFEIVLPAYSPEHGREYKESNSPDLEERHVQDSELESIESQSGSELEPEPETTKFTTRIRMSRTTHSYWYGPKPIESGQSRHRTRSGNDSDDELWEPSSGTRSQVHMSTPTTRACRSGLASPPDSNPFSLDAVKRAVHLKRGYGEDFSSPSKKKRKSRK